MVEWTLWKGGWIIRAAQPSIDRLSIAAPVRGKNALVADQRQLARRRSCSAIWLLAMGIVATGAADAVAAQSHKHTPTQPSKAAQAKHHKGGSAPEEKRSG